jgi:hypothetical protein
METQKSNHQDIVVFYNIWKERCTYPKKSFWIPVITVIVLCIFAYITLYLSTSNLSITYLYVTVILALSMTLPFIIWVYVDARKQKRLNFFQNYEKLLIEIQKNADDIPGLYDKGYYRMLKDYSEFIGIDWEMTNVEKRLRLFQTMQFAPRFIRSIAQNHRDMVRLLREQQNRRADEDMTGMQT